LIKGIEDTQFRKNRALLIPRKDYVSPFLASQVGFAIPEKNGISFDITTSEATFGIADI